MNAVYYFYITGSTCSSSSLSWAPVRSRAPFALDVCGTFKVVTQEFPHTDSLIRLWIWYLLRPLTGAPSHRTAAAASQCTFASPCECIRAASDHHSTPGNGYDSRTVITLRRPWTWSEASKDTESILTEALVRYICPHCGNMGGTRIYFGIITRILRFMLSGSSCGYHRVDKTVF
jgi:predicted RNA-binding Zn-ribbon protein involved in translation (DUF1610 family)